MQGCKRFGPGRWGPIGQQLLAEWSEREDYIRGDCGTGRRRTTGGEELPNPQE
jgi:hypothetical protein